MSENIVIVAAKRTPIGAMQGKFNSVSASELGATAIKAAVEQAGVKPNEIEDVIFGCVLQAGQGQAPARQAAKISSRWGWEMGWAARVRIGESAWC